MKLTPFITGLALAGAGTYLASRYLNYHPRPIEEEEPVNLATAPLLSPGQQIKVLTYNVQFFAGTSYSFFYDGGPDALVDPRDIEITIRDFAAFIAAQDPDFILLQEVDQGARRTAYLNEVELVQTALPAELRNHVATYYWKSRFVPHPKILGSVGTRLVIFSRYRLAKARRYQLALSPGNPIERDFNFKRAILEVEIPLANGEIFLILNTHLEAFPKGTNVLQRQIGSVLSCLNTLDQLNRSWIIGGDFNLLPPGQWARLSEAARGIHTDPSEVAPVFERYWGVPKIGDATGEEMGKYFTFTKRSGTGRLPVRTLDYLFAAPAVIIERYAVQQEGVAELSDHLPVVGEFRLPEHTPFRNRV
jgi:endonuclease/exonuclease/phosphatase family metal-dependent hydrolase